MQERLKANLSVEVPAFKDFRHKDFRDLNSPSDVFSTSSISYTPRSGVHDIIITVLKLFHNSNVRVCSKLM